MARENLKLVGYASIMLNKSLHNKNEVLAVVQDYYLLPDYRAGFTGIRLIQEIMTVCGMIGASRILISERPSVQKEKGGVGKLFKRLGFTTKETIWCLNG